MKKTNIKNGFLSYANKLIATLRGMGRHRMAERYGSSVNSFKRFIGEKDVSLVKITPRIISAYEYYLQGTGVCPNTISFYMRCLRAIYNRAVSEGLITQRYPFVQVYTGVSKTKKRALPVETIRDIRNIDLSDLPHIAFARDMFMFSFYTRGMSFVDMCYLRKDNLRDGVLTYRRRKTGQLLFVRWEKPMQDIVDRYDTAGTPYLLPLIRSSVEDPYKQYKRRQHTVYVNLRRLGDILGLPTPLTTYVARHAWASIARESDVSLSVISEAMGHDSEKTTRIYLASLNMKHIDSANSLIIGLL